MKERLKGPLGLLLEVQAPQAHGMHLADLQKPPEGTLCSARSATQK